MNFFLLILQIKHLASQKRIVFTIILYADDIVLMAESATDLQKLLDYFSDYTDTWKLQVNVDKSKIMIFSRGDLQTIYNSYSEGNN